jgi:enolase-phosphatase E1
MKCVLLDIEGTTTPIDFVHKVLFPFAELHISDFVKANFEKLGSEIEELLPEYKKDFSDQIYGRAFDVNAPVSISEYLKFLISIDRKSKPLKSIQGMIWKNGYESGELKSVMFDDVPKALERWFEQGKTIAVYSSGSVLAQKLIFQYSNFGDLSKYISAYFDTSVGHKREIKSYQNIAEQLQNRKFEILFISDVVEELDAAHAAGFETALSVREGNPPFRNSGNYQIVSSFDNL